MKGGHVSEHRWPNVEEVRAQARERWEIQQRKKSGFYERLIKIVIPVGLFTIATVFFLLSAQHTVEVFGILSPGMGWSAPIGIELGIVYSAFMLSEAAFQGSTVSGAITTLRRLLLTIIVIANGAGSLIVVVQSAGLANLSTANIIASFGTLSATNQVALVLAVLAAFAIPTAAIVSGEGFFHYLTESRRERRTLDELWSQARGGVEFEALRDAAINGGATPGKAARWAAEIARSRFAERGKYNLPQPVFSAGTELTTADDQNVRAKTKIEQAKRMLAENPGLQGVSLRDLEEETGIDKTTWGDAKKEISRNGKHHD